MKKLIFLSAALFTLWNAGAQFTLPEKQITRAETGLGDVNAALAAIGLEVFKFTLPIETNSMYDVIFHLEEYFADSLAVKNVWNMGRTYHYFTEEQGGPAERFSNEIRIVLYNRNARVRRPAGSDNAPENHLIRMEFVGAANMGSGLESKTEYPYASRPFGSQPFDTGKKIPLVMFGSFWKDERGIVRFCGSKELAPDDEMLRLSPHYYIFSVELFCEAK